MKYGSFVFLFLFCNRVYAQDFVGEFLTPPGPAKTTVRIIGTDSVEKKNTFNNSPTSDQRVLIYVPFYEKENEVYGINLKWDHLRIATNETLSSGAKVPSYLVDTMIGGTYKRKLGENDSVAYNLSFGSASDEPFASGGSTTLSATMTYVSTATPISKWIYFLNYSNNRTFANNIPLPGFAYIYMPSREFVGVFGLPFAFVKKTFTEDLSASFLLFLFTYKMELSYRIKGPIQTYISLGNSSQAFYREKRLNDDDRLFYLEKRTLIGIKSPLSQAVMMDMYAGTITERSVYESKKFSLLAKDRTSLDSRYLIGITLSGRF